MKSNLLLKSIDPLFTINLIVLQSLFFRDVFYHLAESRTHSIADELTYKISSTADGNLAKYLFIYI